MADQGGQSNKGQAPQPNPQAAPAPSPTNKMEAKNAVEPQRFQLGSQSEKNEGKVLRMQSGPGDQRDKQ